MKSFGIGIDTVPVTTGALAALIKLVDAGAISGFTAKNVFERMWESGRSAAEIVKQEGLAQIDDTDTLRVIVANTLASNRGAVLKYRSGKTSTLGFLVGQVMRLTKGKANPQLVNDLLRQMLSDAD